MRKLFIVLLLNLALFAQNDFEVSGTDFDVEDDVITSDDGVVLLHKGKYFYAKKAVYNNKKGEVVLDGNVLVIDNNQVSIASDHALINMKDDNALFVPFYMIDDKSKLWIKSKEGKSRQKQYSAKKSITSSCNPDDPDWAIEFSSMEFDSDSELLDLYNSVLYVKDMPLFYFPYLRLSTNKDRRSGLLRPTLGIGGDDGFFYEQPIFIAPSLWWDIELNPQIRTKRSTGAYGTLRFVNSDDAHGRLRMGHFKSKDKYVQENDLEHSSHGGIEFFYDDASIFDGLDDGFYFDGRYVSDIDYFDLTSKEDVSANAIGDNIESKMNYYVTDGDFFFGSYSKYYKDMTKDSNKDTIQLLPKTQLHKFNNSLISENILYSVDISHSNYTRRDGVKAQQYEFSLPITFHTQLFNEYLNFSVSENFYATKVNFTKGYQSYKYYRNYHQISLFTDLLKAYENGYHNMNFGVNYTHPEYEKEDLEYNFLSSVQKQFFDIVNPSRGFNLYLKQYFYNHDEKEVFYHKLNQPFSYNDFGIAKAGDLENSFRFNLYEGLSINLRTFYNHDESDFSRVISSINLRKEVYDMTLRHLYTNDFNGNRDSYLTFNAGYNYNQYRFFTSIDYDYSNKYIKKKSLGFRMKKRCWDYAVILSEDITPTLTNSSSNSKKDRSIMFEINLVPLGGIAQNLL